MSKLYTASLAAVLSLLGATLAHAQQTQPARPGETPTQGAPTQTQSPSPSTSPTEGTAADRTPPGKTPTSQGATQRSELVGAPVVSTTQAPIGQVVDVVFDSKNQPAFVVISSEGKAVAVPYSVAKSMKSADKIVMDRSRLQAAPKVKEGEWRNEAGTWKDESARYWNRG
jgi:sporulation protein YlmC with PRC-barrel domain